MVSQKGGWMVEAVASLRRKFIEERTAQPAVSRIR